MSDTNPAPGDGDTTTDSQENDAAYRGLQKVLAKRDTDLATSMSAYEALKAEHDATTAELTTYRERDAAANAEETARQTYEDLKARFEAPPPVPVGSNPARDWTTTTGEYASRERRGTSQGWPT